MAVRSEKSVSVSFSSATLDRQLRSDFNSPRKPESLLSALLIAFVICPGYAQRLREWARVIGVALESAISADSNTFLQLVPCFR